MFAMHSYPSYITGIARPSVCLSSVTLVHPTQAIEIFGSSRYLVPWLPVDIQVKFYGDRPRGTPLSWELNTRGVAKYSDFEHIERCKIGAKLVLITNRKSYMSFRLVPNSVTLDDLERRNSSKCSAISPNSVAFWITQNWLKIHQYFLRRKCRPKNLVFSER